MENVLHWFKKFRKDINQTLNDVEESVREAEDVAASSTTTTHIKSATPIGNAVDIADLKKRYTDLGRAHNKLRGEHNTLRSRFEVLRTSHNEAVKKLKAEQQEAEERLERRLAKLRSDEDDRFSLLLQDLEKAGIYPR